MILYKNEHHSHFPQAYAAKDYSADATARALFKHFATFGVFDALASDPSSVFMSDVIAQLNKWLGVEHKVSLVGRHESNGCEATSRKLLRHLKCLVADERLMDSWSDDTILPLVNFQLCSFPTSETGGITPFELKYGTKDAKYFKLPEGLHPGALSHELLQRLDSDIDIEREISTTLQD